LLPCELGHIIDSLQLAVGDFHRKISYAYFTAFISLLNNMELMKKIYMAATKRDKEGACTKGEDKTPIE